jgi:II/X family phage/plasmid replication protein
MIDWVTAVLPYTHSEPINSGHLLSISRYGEIEWATKKRLSVRGSYESALLIKSVEETRKDGYYKDILVDGNFVKFHQGHNLFGTNNLIGLVAETYDKLADLLELTPTEIDYQRLYTGKYALKRIDCTLMVDLGSLAHVEAFLYSAERSAHLKHRGQGIMTKGTLYFGKHSRRWSLKMYAKGKEINAAGHRLPREIDSPALQAWASSKLRIELVLRSMTLIDRNLHIAEFWNDNTPVENLYESLESLNMSEKHVIPPTELDNLSPRLRLAYNSWLDGHDLKAILPHNTFYSYRRQLKEFGIDIAVKQGDREQPAANVVEFRQILRPQLCEQIPEWAIGTPLYFEPRTRMKNK